MSVSIWTFLVAVYIVVFSRFRNGKAAPRGAIIGLEIPTIVFWFGALIALALFAVEIEPICLLADEVPVVRKIVATCIVMKTATAAAALSWLVLLCSPASPFSGVGF